MISFKDYLLLTEVTIDQIKDRTKEFKPEFFKHHDQNAQHKTKDSIIDHFAAGNKPEHVPWIISQYKKQNVRQEDAGRIKSTLDNFSTHKSKLANRDINQYGHISDLEDALEPHLDKAPEMSGKEKDKLYRNPDGSKVINHPGADVIHHENNVTAYHIKTQEAASDFGSGSNWCTAPKDGMFHQYQPLYCVHAGNQRYQFHFPSDQFMDEKDRRISPENLVGKHPELSNIKEFKKHVGFLAPHESYKDYDYLIAKHGTYNEKLKLLDKENLDKDSQVKIASDGNKDHLHKLLNRPELHHEVQTEIAFNAHNDYSHIKKLINREDFHDETQKEISKNIGTHDTINVLLDTPKKLHLETQKNIISFGGKKNISKLLDRPDLNPDTHPKIAFIGFPAHIDKLLDRPDLNSNAHTNIAIDGTDEHRTRLLDRPDLNPDSHDAFIRHGNNEHLHKLLKRSDLNPDSYYTISKLGPLDYITHLLKRSDLTNRTREVIKKRLNARSPQK